MPPGVTLTTTAPTAPADVEIAFNDPGAHNVLELSDGSSLLGFTLLNAGGNTSVAVLTTSSAR